MGAIRAANLALRFALELCMLGALLVWGFTAGPSPLARIGLGLGAPVAAAVVWGIFLSPNATVRLPVVVRVLLELLLFGAACAALAVVGYQGLALAFGVLVLANELLLGALGQRADGVGAER